MLLVLWYGCVHLAGGSHNYGCILPLQFAFLIPAFKVEYGLTYIPSHTGAVALTFGFTNGAGQIWLSKVQCRGNETRLTDCTHTAFGVHSCTHVEDAGVRCTTCTQGSIRLQGGNATSGRVEICNSNEWGTVCDDLWDTVDAQVACRYLGFETTGLC